MKKYLALGLKNTAIGTAYLFSQVLVLQFLESNELWVVLPNGMTLSSLSLIVVGCIVFAIGAVNLFFGSMFLDFSKSDDIKEHIYLHGKAVFRWAVMASGFIFGAYLLLVFTSVLSFNPDGFKAFAYYGEAFEPFMCALTKSWLCPE